MSSTGTKGTGGMFQQNLGERAFNSGLPACVNVLTDRDPSGVKGGYEFK